MISAHSSITQQSATTSKGCRESESEHERRGEEHHISLIIN